MEPIRIQLPSGEEIWARVDGADGPRDVGLREKAQAVADFNETIGAVAGNVRQALSHLRLDEISVAFGVELVAKTGKLITVLAEAGGSANLTLTVTWKADGGNGGGDHGVTA